MLKICHIITGLNVGGAELFLKRLIESSLNRDDISHSVISLTDLGVIGPDLVQKGVSVNVVGLNKSVVRFIPSFFRLRRLIKKSDPDVISTWLYHADLLGGFAAHSVGKKNVVWGIRSENIAFGKSKFTIVVRKLCAWSSKFIPKKIICVAHASKEAHKDIGYDNSKMLVINNGFNIEKFRSASISRSKLRKSLGISEKHKIVVSVARYNQVKDHSTFVKASGLVAERHKDVCFMLIGRDLSCLNTELVEMVNSTGKPDIFYLLDEVTDVSSYLQASDIFCLHSTTEGFPNALGEAMAAGLPCVATDVGDAAFLLGSCEYISPPASPVELAEKIGALLLLPEVARKEIGDLSIKRIKNNFTMDLISHQYYMVYNSIAN